MGRPKRKMGLHAVWAMAVGGMVGGGIFSAIGVVADKAGAWAWLSFLLAGIVALCTGHSYLALTAKFERGGGAFEFLRDVKHEKLAGNLSWVLILGYVLTMAVYAFTFGHYVGQVAGLSPWVVRALAAAVVVVLTAVNLLGVGESSWIEIITVWGKLLVLLALASFGFWMWSPDSIAGASDKGVPGHLLGACIGAGVIFMSFEGFQLLAYDYDDIREPRKTLRLGIYIAIPLVIAVYIVVALGAASLVGTQTLVDKREIALASAGKAALGLPGMIAVSVAAAFSTGSAINATLFSTARLTRRVARKGELPGFLCHENSNAVPDRSILLLAALSIGLASIGSLERLVTGASIVFLLTFAAVNWIAFRQSGKLSSISLCGLAGALLACIAVIYHLATNDPWVLAGAAGVIGLLLGTRWLLLKLL